MLHDYMHQTPTCGMVIILFLFIYPILKFKPTSFVALHERQRIESNSVIAPRFRYLIIFEKGQFPGIYIIGYNKTVKMLIAKIVPQRYAIIGTNIYALIAIADILNPFTPH